MALSDRKKFPDKSVDLAYLDPLFNSNGVSDEATDRAFSFVELDHGAPHRSPDPERRVRSTLRNTPSVTGTR